MAMGSFASAPLRLRMTATLMVQGEPWLMRIVLKVSEPLSWKVPEPLSS